LNQARAEARGRGAKWVLDIYRRFGDLIVETPSVRHFVSTEREAALRVMTSAPSPLQRRVIDTFVDVLREAEATKGLKLRIDAETLAYVLVRVAESFLWTDLITGEPPNLTKALEVAEVLLS
jgi:hypothetical protein